MNNISEFIKKLKFKASFTPKISFNTISVSTTDFTFLDLSYILGLNFFLLEAQAGTGNYTHTILLPDLQNEIVTVVTLVKLPASTGRTIAFKDINNNEITVVNSDGSGVSAFAIHLWEDGQWKEIAAAFNDPA